MFEWDEAKRHLNRLKHGVDFLDAALIFAGPVLIKEDRRRDYGEQRFIALGRTDGQIYVVAYTMRDDDIRLISAWKGGRREREHYEKSLDR